MADTHQPGPNSPAESTLERLLADYMESLERGAPLDPRQVIEEHPDLEAELKSYFRNRAALEEFTDRLPLDETMAETVAHGEIESPRDGVIRYFGDYELEQEIGRGGMGVVYRARQRSLNRTVALKMILAGPHASPHEVQRLRNEAEAVAQLDHPHIVPLLEIGSHDGQTYFSMKLIEGTNLAESLPDFTSSPIRAARLMATVARAVDHAHQHGILHRDLKPANILLDSQGTPHLTDFGLAKQTTLDEDLTQTGAILGTPHYMAPEQARGEKHLTTSADIYSLGAMLHELLTGRPPFQSDSITELLRLVVEQEAVPPHQVAAGIPPSLGWICAKCLEKSPERRYHTALELAEDLQRWLRHEPIQARPARPIERTSKWIRRHPTLTLLLLSALLGLAGIVWQWWQAVQANERYLVELDQRRWGLAEREWQANDVLRARRLLSETPPSRRDWTWNYLWRLTHNTPHNRLPELGSLVTALATSPDGRRLAFAEWNGDLWVRELASGRTLLHATLDTPHVPCTLLAFAPCNDLLLVLHSQGWQLWDLDKELRVLERPSEGRPVSVAWHPNEKQFYVASRVTPKNQKKQKKETPADEEAAEEEEEEEGREENYDLVEAFEWGSGERLFIIRQEPSDYHRRMASMAGSARALAWPKDGDHQLHMATDGRRLYHLGSRNYYHPLTGDLLGKLDLPDGDGEVYPTTGALLRALADNERVALLAPPDTVDNRLLILQQVGSHERVTFTIPNNQWHELCLSPDGRHLSIADWSQNEDENDLILSQTLPILGPLLNARAKKHPWVSTVYLYETTDGVLRRTLRGFPSVATHLVFRPDGRQLFVGGGQTVERSQIWMDEPRAWGDIAIWNVLEPETSRVLEGHTGEIRHLATAPSGGLLASSSRDGRVRLWDLETGQPHPSSPIFRHRDSGGWVGADFAPDSPRLAVCGDATIQLIDTQSGSVERTMKLEPNASVHAVSLCRDPNLLACMTPRDARVYDLRRNKVVFNIPEATDPRDDARVPTSVRLSPDGKLLAVTYQFDTGGELRLYEIPSRKLVWSRQTTATLSPFRTGWGLTRASFSLDGRHVAAVGNNGEALVYHVGRGTLLHRFQGEGYSVWGVTFSPDGRQLVTGSFDRTIRVWDLERGEQRFVLRGHREPVQAVCFSPDGQRLISGSRDGQIRIWESDGEPGPARF